MHLLCIHFVFPLTASCDLRFYVYQCGNCFGRFTKSQKLDLRTTQDFLGADIGEAVPLNNPLGTSSSNEMENNGSNSCQQRPSSSIDANHLSLEAHSPAENDVNSPYVNHGTHYLSVFKLMLYLSCMLIGGSCVHTWMQLHKTYLSICLLSGHQ